MSITITIYHCHYNNVFLFMALVPRRHLVRNFGGRSWRSCGDSPSAWCCCCRTCLFKGNPSGNPSDLCGIYVDWNLWLGDGIFWFYGTFMGGNWITDIHSIWDKYGYFLGQWNIHGAMAMQSLSPNLHRLGCHHVTMVDVGDETWWNHYWDHRMGNGMMKWRSRPLKPSLVGGWPIAPLKNDGVRQLGWWNSQYKGKIKKETNHQQEVWRLMTSIYELFSWLPGLITGDP